MSRLLKIDHKSTYFYEEVVSLSPHDVLIFPQPRTYFELKDTSLHIRPDPKGKYERINAEGNIYYNMWFEGETTKLEVLSSITVELFEFNPFGFILKRDLKYPFSNFQYEESDKIALSPCLIQEEDASLLLEFVDKVMQESMDLVSFLTRLVSQVKETWSHVQREEEGILPLSKIFASKSGSCRDLSWLMIQMLRAKGLASRFVSGYAFNPDLDTGHELHAWVEVYLPGGGWVGLDPSLGLFADEFYIPLACSHDPLLTMPIYGSFSGTKSSRLETQVDIIQINK
ncbi:transglutaminase family protein [Belliella sp. DSM 111904]|uniref:Transglutaminase family protein n=1 Tax=Belliella filtrata TaxID=2923435 RepID=A0ABS9V076_9BACT|nr:transglutaminase family protein [Belliella filtrata]MCH7409405.1 transglutaminase family protein [Belliella filtrata]